MPLFLIAGYKYKKLKEELAEQLDSKDEDVSIAAQKTIQTQGDDAKFDAFGAREIENLSIGGNSTH